jgi:hypothetical protein
LELIFSNSKIKIAQDYSQDDEMKFLFSQLSHAQAKQGIRRTHKDAFGT